MRYNRTVFVAMADHPKHKGWRVTLPNICPTAQVAEEQMIASLKAHGKHYDGWVVKVVGLQGRLAILKTFKVVEPPPPQPKNSWWSKWTLFKKGGHYGIETKGV